MNKYVLVIIDDEIKMRRSAYEMVFGADYFDLVFVENLSDRELAKMNEPKVHGIVIDVNLGRWTLDNSLESVFRAVAEKVGDQIPTILISSQWSAETIAWVNRSKDKIAIRHYLAWDHGFATSHTDSDTADYTSIRENVKKELDLFHARESMVLEPNESIKILHISDLQFGDKAIDSDSVLLEVSIPQFLTTKDLKPHLIAFTGDVAFSGQEHEYENAKRWLKKLCESVLGPNFGSRLLLVPGNHDVNMSLNSVGNYRYSFGNKHLEPVTDPVRSHTGLKYGLIPFREFCYQMTQNIQWLTNSSNLCFINDSFLNWGLRFFHLNSAALQNEKDPSLAGMYEGDLGDLATQDGRSHRDMFKIILSHHHPEALGHKIMGSDARWNLIRSFAEVTRSNIFLHGHSHGFKTYNVSDEGEHTKKIKYHMTSTLSLETSQRMKDSKRGFSVIEISRADGRPIGTDHVRFRNFEIVGEKIREITEA